MNKCIQPDKDNPRYRCPSVAMEGYDQCLNCHQEYVSKLEKKLVVAKLYIERIAKHNHFDPDFAQLQIKQLANEVLTQLSE